MTESVELKACPFCGANDQLVTDFGITCRACHTQVCGAGTASDVEAWNRRVSAAPDGWVMVPREPPLAMQHAYFDVIDSNLRRVENDARFGRYDNHRLAYRAMLSAAPVPPEQGGGKSSSREREQDLRADRGPTPGLTAEAASPWRPIETAPKDGTDFLGVNARIGAGPYICHWQEGEGPVRDLDDDLERADRPDSWCGWVGRDFYANPRWLSHWMPLPQLPTPTTQEADHAE